MDRAYAQRLSAQVRDNRHGRRWTPAGIHGTACPGARYAATLAVLGFGTKRPRWSRRHGDADRVESYPGSSGCTSTTPVRTRSALSTITQSDDARSDELIYRVVGESSEWVWSEESGALEISPSPGRLMGAFNADIARGAWGDLPMPMLSNPRVRFWFTERGCRAYGLRVAAEARASGRAFRVIRRKNPSRSTVIYRDDWQVALLPDRD